MTKYSAIRIFPLLWISLIQANELPQDCSSLKIENQTVCYLQNLQTARNNQERSQIYKQLVAHYKVKQKWNTALEYQIKYIVALDQYGDLTDKVNAQLLLADLYLSAKNLEQAKLTYQKALKFSQDHGGIYWEALSYIGIAKIEKESGKNYQVFLNKAREIANKTKDEELSTLIKTQFSEFN